MQQVDISNYFTKHQSDSRYARIPSPPLAPSNVAIVDSGLSTDLTSAYFDVSLTAPSPPSWATFSPYITGYNVQYSWMDGQGNLLTNTAAMLLMGTGDYRTPPLVPGVSYTLELQAVDYLNQRGAFSAPLTQTTPRSTQPPAAPVVTGYATPTGADIFLAALNTEIDFNHYELWRGEGWTGSSWSVAAPAVVARFSALSFLDQDITLTASDYYYFVRALDYSGNYSDSNIVGPLALNFNTGTPPATPSLTGATAVTQPDGSILFSFPVSLLTDLAGYRIWRLQASQSNWEEMETVAASTGVTGTFFSYLDTSAIPGFTYQYSYAVFNTEELISDFAVTPVISALSQITTPVLPPTNLTFLGIPGGVTASWTLAAGSGLLYQVSWRYAQSGDPRLTAWTTVLTPNNSFDIVGLIDPVETPALPFTREQLADSLEVSVLTVNAYGQQSSNLDKIIQFPDLHGYVPCDTTPPPGPLSLQAVCNQDDSITLTWTCPQRTDLSGYQVEQLKSGGAWEVLLAMRDATAGQKQYTATGLEPYNYAQAQYRFRVRTFDNSGNISSINLLDNPAFATGALTPWISAGATLVSTNTRNGEPYALRVSSPTPARQTIPVIAGLNYIASIWYCLDPSTTSALAYLQLSFYQSDGVTLTGSNNQSNGAAATGYNRLSVAAQAPLNAAFAVITALGDTNNPANHLLYSDAQLEQSDLLSDFAADVTPWLNAVDNSGPQDYALGLTGVGALNQLILNWTNPAATSPVAYFYIHSVFEIWRSLDGIAFTKIDEVLGTDDGLANTYTDFGPTPAGNVTWQYKLRARDRWGNPGPYLNGGAALTIRSLSMNDVSIQDSTNLVSNPGFEFGPVGWAADLPHFGIVNDPANAENGNGVGESTSTAFYCCRNLLYFSVHPGDQFYLSAWFKGSAGASGNAQVRLSVWDANKLEIEDEYVPSVSLSTTYQNSAGMVTVANPGAVYGRAELVLPGTPGMVYVDNVICRTAANQLLMQNHDGTVTPVSTSVSAAQASLITINGNIGLWNLSLNGTIASSVATISGSVGTVNTTLTNNGLNAGTNIMSLYNTVNGSVGSITNIVTANNMTLNTNVVGSIGSINNVITTQILNVITNSATITLTNQGTGHNFQISVT